MHDSDLPTFLMLALRIIFKRTRVWCLCVAKMLVTECLSIQRIFSFFFSAILLLLLLLHVLVSDQSLAQRLLSSACSPASSTKERSESKIVLFSLAAMRNASSPAAGTKLISPCWSVGSLQTEVSNTTRPCVQQEGPHGPTTVPERRISASILFSMYLSSYSFITLKHAGGSASRCEPKLMHLYTRRCYDDVASVHTEML